jgi:dUTP pyrophosphatase
MPLSRRLIETNDYVENLTMIIKVINKSNNELPTYGTVGSAGVDLRAYLEKDIILNPMEQCMIPTGLYFELPERTFGMITPRSGLASKHGISITNSPGILDETYRGECKIILINLGKEIFKISNGDRIAQFILMNYQKIDFDLVEKLSETERGEGGFGSTKIK